MIQFPVDLDGHFRCSRSGCDNQVPVHVAYLTRRLCFECFLLGDWEQIHAVEVLHRAQRIPTTTHVKSKQKKKKHTAAVQARRHRSQKAKDAALTRLRMLYPDMYDLLYAEERHKRGLLPLPNRDPDKHTRTIETYLRANGYAPAQTAGEPD